MTGSERELAPVNFPARVGQEHGVPHTPADAEVIRLSLTDPSAFEVVFDRHFDSMYGYLARRVGADVARDLTSEVFVRAFETRSRYDLKRADAMPWLYGIAGNVLRERRRTENRGLRAYAPSSDGAEPTVFPTELDPVVAAAVARMKPAARETLLLLAWADLDYEQIAEALQIPVGTVRSRLNRARRQLRSALREDAALCPEEAFNG